MKKNKNSKKLIKNLLIITLLAFTAGISYFYSYKVYSFYSKLYIMYWRKYLPDDIVKIIERKSETRNNITELQEFVDRSLQAYPNNHEIMKSAGLAYIKLGLLEKGVGLYLLAYERRVVPTPELYNLAKMLFEQRDYRSVISLVRAHSQSKDSKIAGILGTSLFFVGRFEEAIPELEQYVYKQGDDIDRLFFLGMSYVNLGSDLQALPYLERAYRLDKTNRKIIGELVALYGRIGETKKASQLVNSLSWRLRH